MDGGILSQDEINALLNGMDLSGEANADTSADAPAENSAQENINQTRTDYLSGTDAVTDDSVLLSDMEKDAIGEVANISMGSSATTLYSLVNRRVNITTPVVTLAKWDNLIEQYEKPCVFIQIKYTQGLDGTNILVLKESDVKIITDLMMGGDGSNIGEELGELHLSAISEAMNQMMGSAATSLSTMLSTVIDISPPESSLLNLSELASGGSIAPFLNGTFVKISFRMQIGDLVDSTIMQLYPVDFAKKLVQTFLGNQLGEIPQEETPAKQPEPTPAPTAAPGFEQPAYNMGMDGNGNMGMNPMGMNGMGMNMGMNPMGMNGMGMNMGMNPMMNGMGMNMGMNPMAGMPQMNVPNVNVQPAQFQSFSETQNPVAGQENIGLIMDVPLEVTVELGRTTKSISDILNFAPGTIIELNRIAGEPIDVLVNGKFVARGEVVVIEENFGIRVTEIIK